MTKRKPQPRIPKTLSGKLRMAVRDAQAFEKRPNHMLDMDTFGEMSGLACCACMGGAVISQRWKMSDRRLAQGNWSEKQWELAWDIDCMRGGGFWLSTGDRRGITAKDRRRLEKAAAIVKASSQKRGDGRAEWPVYLKAADLLEKAGL